MPTSKKPQDRQVKKSRTASSVASFKKKSGSAQLTELPSGNTVKVRPIPITDMLAENILPDSLTGMVQEMLSKQDGNAKPEVTDEEVRDLMSSPKKIAEMFDIFDRVAAKVVIEPDCHYHRRLVDGSDSEWETIPEDERDEEILYSDDMDFDDKSFLFQFAVGGTKDLERFREGSSAAVGSLAAVSSV
jgi:hypothetical protein